MSADQASGAGETRAAQEAAMVETSAVQAVAQEAAALETTALETAAEAATLLEIRVNGEPRRCAAGLTLVQVLENLGYRPPLVVVEFNGDILPRQRWSAQTVVESDVLEVVTIVGGGS